MLNQELKALYRRVKQLIRGLPDQNREDAFIDPVWYVLVISGFIGFSLGAFVIPSTQYCLEYGQVLAGIVVYPPDLPEGLFMRHSWSLLNQLSAVGLLCGLTESTLSILISGLLGMVSFQALASFIYAITNRVLLSALTPVLIFATKATFFGKVYPVMLLGFWATHGIFGLSYIVLVVAMIGAGKTRTGALLLGLAPAWHLVLGGLMWPVVLLAWLSNRRKLSKRNLVVAAWFSTGAFLALISFWIHHINLPPIPDVSPAEMKRHFLFFIKNWDLHRQPAVFTSAEVLLNLLGLAVVFTYLKKNTAEIPERLRHMFKILIIAGSLAIAFGLLTHLPTTWLPMAFTRAMPARLLNLFVICYAAMTLGLLTRDSAKGTEQLFATVILVVLLVATAQSPVMSHKVVLGTLIFGGAILLLLSIPAAGLLKKLAIFGKIRTPLKIGQVLLLLGFTLWTCAGYETMFSWGRLRQAQAGPKPKGAPSSELLLAAAVFDRTQLRTRRPRLVDPGTLDHLPYFPQLAPAVASILQDVYGIDFFNPPVESLHTGELKPKGIERGLWESWPLERWRTLREKYHVADVLVPDDWMLHLPMTQRGQIGGRTAALYHIPASDEEIINGWRPAVPDSPDPEKN